MVDVTQGGIAMQRVSLSAFVGVAIWAATAPALASEVFGWQLLAQDPTVEIYWSPKQSGGKKGDLNVVLVTLDKFAAPKSTTRMDGQAITYYGVIYTDLVSCRAQDGTSRHPKVGLLRQWAILSPNVLGDDIKHLDSPVKTDFKDLPANSPLFPLVTRLCSAL
jgi:hypothetical protein